MPAPRVPPTGAPPPAVEHARHRAAPGPAPRRRRLLVPGALVAAAAAVAGALALLGPAAGPQGPGGGAGGSTARAGAGPGAGTTAGPATGTTPGSAGAPTTPGAAPSSPSAPAQGAAQAAALWLAGQPPQSGAVAVDPDLYDEVASSAQLASRLVPAPTSTPDGELPARWVVSGPALRAAPPGSWAATALAASSAVAVFGEGQDRVEVRELAGAEPGAGSGEAPVVPLAAEGTGTPSVTPAPPAASATAADPASLEQLQRNPRLDFSPRAREALAGEQVDLRLAALLVQLAAVQPLSVADLPASYGAPEPVRTVLLDGIAGAPVGSDPDALATVERQLSAQDGPYRATARQQRDGSTPLLRLELPPAGT